MGGWGMNEITATLIGFIFGIVIGWVAFGMSVIEDCKKINGFVAAGNAYTCEVKK
jgi:hypothetical protein